MAQLAKKAYAFEARGAKSFMDVMDQQAAELRRLEEVAAKLPEEVLKGRLLSIPVADGKATYLVASESPLILQHVPFFDGYAVDAGFIRGMRLDDVWDRVRSQARLKAMFERTPSQAL